MGHGLKVENIQSDTFKNKYNISKYNDFFFTYLIVHWSFNADFFLRNRILY